MQCYATVHSTVLQDRSPTVKFDTTQLLAALKAIKPAIAPRATLPILSAVAFEVLTPDFIAVRATNLDITLRVNVPNQDPKNTAYDGHVVILYASLMKVIDSKKSDTIEISAADNFKARVTQGNRSVTVDTLAYEDVPVFPEMKTHPLFPLTLTQWTKIRERVFPCVARDQSRPVLHGVNVIRDDDQGIKFVAADGFRLTIHATGEYLSYTFPGFIVPIEALEAIPAKCEPYFWELSDGGAYVKVEINLPWSKHADDMAMMMYARTLDGHFPNYQEVEKSSNYSATHEIRVEEDVIQEARKFIKDSDGIKFHEDRASMKVHTVGEYTWNGTSTTLKPIDPSELATIKGGYVMLNAEYVADTLYAAKDGVLTLQGSSDNPWKVDSGDTQTIIMPMVLGTS